MNSLEKPIVNWFRKNKRDLPWRNTSPWGVMVSEHPKPAPHPIYTSQSI